MLRLPTKLFLRAITAAKLTAQSKNDMSKMLELSHLRDCYILAHDQIFFPLNSFSVTFFTKSAI